MNPELFVQSSGKPRPVAIWGTVLFVVISGYLAYTQYKYVKEDPRYQEEKERERQQEERRAEIRRELEREAEELRLETDNVFATHEQQR